MHMPGSARSMATIAWDSTAAATRHTAGTNQNAPDVRCHDPECLPMATTQGPHRAAAPPIGHQKGEALTRSGPRSTQRAGFYRLRTGPMHAPGLLAGHPLDSSSPPGAGS
ncbi:hypothetical protein GCM10011374_24090 [Kocuria dechangensis]|uniref:Uncharacterized protein n=1 Tax=Kocuria dechangensis TaxID=1176249 RepID=A0A917GXG8_9MICC|nr:hypothetical protein GCM10011374_24090 [Kocuria dechangensis]